MSWELYVSLSAMMALEYAIRGSWGPVLSARLLGPLGMTGKQVGWIYAMYPLTCIAAPLIAGQIVDRWIATEWFLAAAHLASGVALLFAARATRFRWLLVLIGIHCLFFSPTLGLVKSLTFAHLSEPKVQYPGIRVWASIAWMAVGILLSLWRRSGKLVFQGSDSLLLAGVLSIGMAVFCPLGLPHTPPAGGSDWTSAWAPLIAMFQDRNIQILLGISLIAATQLQFYYMTTAPFLEDIGFAHASVPAVMSVAQLAEMAATALALRYLLPLLGFRLILALGPLLWVVMYGAYVIQRPRWLVAASMALHGFAFAFFFDAAIMYINETTSQAIRGTAQSLYVMVTLGIGLFLGTHFTGLILDRFRVEGRRNWRAVFATPCITLALCALAFLLFFTGQ